MSGRRRAAPRRRPDPADRRPCRDGLRLGGPARRLRRTARHRARRDRGGITAGAPSCCSRRSPDEPAGQWQSAPVNQPAPSDSASVLRTLGLDALVDIIETIGYGVCITGENHTWTYANPAAARIIGEPFEQLRGRDYLLHFPEHERAPLLALEHKQREGDTGFYTNTVIQHDGTELEMTWSGTVVEVDGVELAPAIFHETTAVRRAQREAAELGVGSVRIAQGRSTAEVFDALVGEAVAATRAEAALLLTAGGDGLLRLTATQGVPAALEAAVEASPARLSDLPAGPLLLRGRGGFLADDRTRLAANPVTRPWAEAVGDLEWVGSAKFPVHHDGEVVGCLVVVVPERLTAPSEAELALWSSLAEQAGVALGADLLWHEVSHASAMLERRRIARELHDSVNHALFALQTRAYLIQRALESADVDRARAAALDLDDLARQATTEMRELLTELRPTATTAVDLTRSLRDLADLVTRRDGVAVDVAAPTGDLGLHAATTEHLLRIAGEALHNVVKHARATRVTITLTHAPRRVELAVVDDGDGFDPAVVRPGTHGQQTMRERARLCGGQLRVTSRPGAGTSVAVVVPG
ncbi:PAS domain S-box protein [Georgenia yuyongxinii]|uniref:PAS domain S-box protein n=1 Tax=Georgenia yuyongxinii TaxID=2589797 RepID=A0A552WTN2_9MICO|nr:PAS domain S-box protein [Georgenia yuyongxinii]